MSVPARAAALLAALLVVAGCGGAAPATGGPSTSGPGATTPAQSAATEPTTGPVAGEPCSFLTAEALAEVLGSVPVEVEERAGRGDCDYWLDAAQTQKVNIGVATGADGQALFEGSKALGETLPVPNLGDDAYMLVLDDLGTIVVAKAGDAVVSVQLLNAMDSAEQAIRAINLARAVVEGL